MAEDVATPTTGTQESSLRSTHLSLPKSGILLENGALIRRTRDGTDIARHPLEEISGVQLVKSFSFTTLILGLGIGALAVVTKAYIESSAWSWIVGGGLALPATCVILGSWGLNLRVESDGAVANYVLLDQDDDCQGFTLSLTSVWKKSRSRDR